MLQRPAYVVAGLGPGQCTDIHVAVLVEHTTAATGVGANASSVTLHAACYFVTLVRAGKCENAVGVPMEPTDTSTLGYDPGGGAYGLCDRASQRV